MKRIFTDFYIENVETGIEKLLCFGQKHSNFCLLNRNQYNNFPLVPHQVMAAIGAVHTTINPTQEELEHFQKHHRDWIFGHVSYDYKNAIEPSLFSENPDFMKFSVRQFFIPEILVFLSVNTMQIGVLPDSDAEDIFARIMQCGKIISNPEIPALTPRFTKEEYLDTVRQLQQHITLGDCYEVCFCMEFYTTEASLHPTVLFQKLNRLSPNPFSIFYKENSSFLIGSSPERYLQKRSASLISQPIKGTIKRSRKDANSDAEEMQWLRTNPKERAENIMITDLVRNDFARVCKRGSVHVKELCGIYSFPQVHQMISTIEGEVDKDVSFSQALEATFPMGSMTGAPKVKAMELIERYEKSRRGLYSGTVGYITPDGDFDFAVVIRSILYQADGGYVSVQAGSAITALSEGEREYEECLAKISAMMQALT